MPDIRYLMPEKGSGGEGEGEYSDRVEMQMRRLGRALKTGDFKAAAEAFRAAHEECADSSEPDADADDMTE